MSKKKLFFQRARFEIPTTMIMSWNITANDTITLPIFLKEDGVAFINWGDGTETIYRYGEDDSNKTHTYTATAILDIEVASVLMTFSFYDYRFNQEKVLEVKSWGNSIFKGLDFYNCTNMIVSAIGIPDFSQVDALGIVNMFRGCSNVSYIANIENWDLGSAESISLMFTNTKFNQDISNWDVSNINNINALFRDNTVYNQPLNWTFSSTKDIVATYVFTRCTSFNQPLNNWNTERFISIGNIFEGATSFNQPLDNWDVSNVTVFSNAFKDSIFNQDISSWNVNKGTSFISMFRANYAFNQPLNNWVLNTIGTVNLTGMFNNSVFNQPLNNWNVSSVIDFRQMFRNSPFSYDLSSWVLNSNNSILMDAMFHTTNFNNSLSNWNIEKVTSLNDFFLDGVGMTTANYDATLISWSNQNVVSGLTVNFGGAKYTIGGAAETARNTLINTYGWTITDGGGI